LLQATLGGPAKAESNVCNNWATLL
jgi:hypothetical protein